MVPNMWPLLLLAAYAYQVVTITRPILLQAYYENLVVGVFWALNDLCITQSRITQPETLNPRSKPLALLNHVSPNPKP